MNKKNFSWWLGLFIAIASSLATYLSSCSTQTKFSIVADSIEQPHIIYSDSSTFKNPLKK